jgi:hypothetical protein
LPFINRRFHIAEWIRLVAPRWIFAILVISEGYVCESMRNP